MSTALENATPLLWPAYTQALLKMSENKCVSGRKCAVMQEWHALFAAPFAAASLNCDADDTTPVTSLNMPTNGLLSYTTQRKTSHPVYNNTSTMSNRQGTNNR